jgi:ABC-2 type transport system permease protein
MTDTTLAGGAPRQLSALFRMEVVLLQRNMATAVLVVILPIALGVGRLGWAQVGAGDASAGAERMASAIGMIAAIFVHHHLVTVYAARRQELVLKRLRAGLPSDGTIIAGAASAATAVFIAQTLILVAYAVLVLRFPLPVNPVPILLAVLLAAALMVTTSAVVSAVTRSSEAAMITTFPTVALFLVTPGVLLPYGALPEAVEDAAWFSPMGPFGELIRIGWVGTDGDTDLLATVVTAFPGLAIMSAWLVLTALLVRRFFRWEPRHR